MPSSEIAVIITLAIVAIAGVCWILIRRRRSEHLRHRFGPEYDRVTKEHGNQRRAEAVLETREKRVERLHIHPLTPKDRDHFAQGWQAEQARFVDDPEGAVVLQEVMEGRVRARLA